MKYESSNINILLRNNPLGFGYEIIDKFNKKFNLIFRTSNKEQAESLFNDLKTKDSIEHDEIPEIDYEPKLLIIKEKYCNTYILIKYIEMLNEISFNYLKREFESDNLNLWDIYEVTISEDFISACKDEDLKEELIGKRKSQLDYKKQVEEHNNLINLLKRQIENTNFDRCYSILAELYGENVYLEDLTKDFNSIIEHE